MVNFSFDFNLFNNYYYLYERLLVLLCSLVPSILLIIFVLFTDRKSKEPAKNIIICLLSGILTIAVARYLEELVMPYIGNKIILTYIWAFIEETSKIAIFLLFIMDNKHYDDIYDGVVYMTLIALSFAGLENIMYAFSESTVSDSISLALMRDFTTIPLHVICGVIIGFYMSLSYFSGNKQKKSLNLILALTIPALIHGTYNVLMNILSSLNINYSKTLDVICVIVLPLLLVLTILFILAYKYSKKCVELNNIYINNGEYNKKYDYLMTYDDYISSSSKASRVKFYKITSLRSDANDKQV